MTRRGRSRKQHEVGEEGPGALPAESATSSRDSIPAEEFVADSVPAGIVGDGMAGMGIADTAPTAPTAPSPASSELQSVRLTTQIGLEWPQDGIRHYYGPGEAQLPAAVVAGLKRSPHQLVQR